jgi:hypothetical protein
MRTHREPARVKEHNTEEEHTPTVREGAPRERGRHSAQRSVHSDDDDMVAECWVNLQQSSIFPTHNDLTAVTCSQVSHDLFLSLTRNHFCCSQCQTTPPTPEHKFYQLCALRMWLCWEEVPSSLAQGLDEHSSAELLINFE